jgi:hypothetical protein
MGKPNNLKVFESNKTKGPKQGSQNHLRSGRRTLVLIKITYLGTLKIIRNQSTM